MLTVDSNFIKDYYDVSFKIRKNGEVIIKKYDNSIIHRIEGYETAIKYKDYSYGGDKLVQEIVKDRDREKLNKCIDQFQTISDIPKEKAIRSDNLNRTRTLLIDYCCENADKFKSFITLTFADKITDIESANMELNKFLTQWRRKLKNQDRQLYYLGVPEFQKNGRVHYHILTSLEHDIDIPKRELLKTFNKDKNKEYEHYYYDIPYWSNGYSTSFDIIKETDDNFNIALYLMKYLYKDIDNRLFGKNRILKSNNLEKPNIIKLKSESDIYKTAMIYIFGEIEDKKMEVAYADRVEIINDRAYSLKYDILNIKCHSYDNILLDIFKDDIEF